MVTLLCGRVLSERTLRRLLSFETRPSTKSRTLEPEIPRQNRKKFCPGPKPKFLKKWNMTEKARKHYFSSIFRHFSVFCIFKTGVWAREAGRKFSVLWGIPRFWNLVELVGRFSTRLWIRNARLFIILFVRNFWRVCSQFWLSVRNSVWGPFNRNSRGNPSFCWLEGGGQRAQKLWTKVLWTNWRFPNGFRYASAIPDSRTFKC